jgi:uncharacterized protein YqeY
MTMIKEQLNHDLKDAMRARDQRKLNTLRLITAAIKQIEVDERITVDDARLIAILDKMAKQRKESIQQFLVANRHDLVDQETYEFDLIASYLPVPLSDEEIADYIEKAISGLEAKQINDMGKVMAHLKPTLQGRADMSKVSALIKAKLSA